MEQSSPSLLAAWRSRIGRMSAAQWKGFWKGLVLILVEVVLFGYYATDTVAVATSTDKMAMWKAIWSVALIDGVMFFLLQIPKFVGDGQKATIIKPLSLTGAWYLYFRMLTIAAAENTLVGNLARQAGFILLGYESLELGVQIVMKIKTGVASMIKRRAAQVNPLTPDEKRAQMRAVVVNAGYKTVLFLTAPVTMIVAGLSLLGIDVLGDILRSASRLAGNSGVSIRIGAQMERDGQVTTGAVAFTSTVSRNRTMDKHLQTLYPLLTAGDEIRTSDIEQATGKSRQWASQDFIGYGKAHGIFTSDVRGVYKVDHEKLRGHLGLDEVITVTPVVVTGSTNV
jgi:hypothetical protein